MWREQGGRHRRGRRLRVITRIWWRWPRQLSSPPVGEGLQVAEQSQQSDVTECRDLASLGSRQPRGSRMITHRQLFDSSFKEEAWKMVTATQVHLSPLFHTLSFLCACVCVCLQSSFLKKHDTQKATAHSRLPYITT